MAAAPHDDASRDEEEFTIEQLRAMSPGQRLELAFELRRRELDVIRQRILADHPDASPHELKLRLASTWLDAETMRRVWGWDPDVEGP